MLDEDYKALSTAELVDGLKKDKAISIDGKSANVLSGKK